MRIFLSIIILMFSIQSSTNADDISDFQIEGISVGDSLLKHLSKDEILNAKRNYFTAERNYYVVGFAKNLKNYEVVDVYLKTGDNKYIVRTLGGMLTIDNLDECLAKKNSIKKEFDQILSHLKNTNHVKDHELDETGDSKQYQQVYYFGNASNRDNHIRIECDKWSKKIKKEMGFNDGLNIVAMTTEILDWVYSGYK